MVSASASEDDVNAVWLALLQAIEQRPAMSWIARSTMLQRIERQVAHFALRDNVKFVTDGQRQQIEQLVSDLVGRRVRVEFAAAAAGEVSRSEASPSPAESPAAAPRSANATGGDRQQAFKLPLVQQVFDVFGQATLLSVRPENQTPAAPDDELRPDDLLDDDTDLPPAGIEEEDDV